jgi:hypothetical protein
MKQLSEYEQLALKRLGQSIQDGKWSNDGLVQLIELSKDFLNPVPMQEYANNHGLSYNGLKKQNKAILLFNQKFIIDND